MQQNQISNTKFKNYRRHTYADNIYALNKSGLTLHGIATHLKLTYEELYERLADESKVTPSDWSKLTQFICFNQVERSKK